MWLREVQAMESRLGSGRKPRSPKHDAQGGTRGLRTRPMMARQRVQEPSRQCPQAHCVGVAPIGRGGTMGSRPDLASVARLTTIVIFALTALFPAVVLRCVVGRKLSWMHKQASAKRDQNTP